MTKSAKTLQQTQKPQPKKMGQSDPPKDMFSEAVKQVTKKSVQPVKASQQDKSGQPDQVLPQDTIPPDGKAPLQGTTSKLCTELKELSVLWDSSEDELLHVGCEGRLVVGIRDLGAAHLQPPPYGVAPPDDYEGDTEKCRFTGVLTLEHDDLARLSGSGAVRVEVANLHRMWGTHRVVINPPRKISIKDIVVPQEEVIRYSNVIGKEQQLPDTPVSEQGKESFQKQIAGLALVIAKVSSNHLRFNKKSGINMSAIADAVLDTFDSLPKEVTEDLNLTDLSHGTIRQNIAQGLELILTKAKNK